MILPELRHELKLNSDSETQNSALRFFKDDIRLYGVKTAKVHKISLAYFQKIKLRPKADYFEILQ